MDFTSCILMGITGHFGPSTTGLEFGMKTKQDRVEQRIDIGVSSFLTGEAPQFTWTATGCWNLSQKNIMFQLKINGKR